MNDPRNDVTVNPQPRKRKQKGISIHRTCTTDEVMKRLGIGKTKFTKMKEFGLILLGAGRDNHYYGLNIIETLRRTLKFNPCDVVQCLTLEYTEFQVLTKSEVLCFLKEAQMTRFYSFYVIASIMTMKSVNRRMKFTPRFTPVTLSCKLLLIHGMS